MVIKIKEKIFVMVTFHALILIFGSSTLHWNFPLLVDNNIDVRGILAGFRTRCNPNYTNPLWNIQVKVFGKFKKYKGSQTDTLKYRQKNIPKN